ncbi:MAG: hypothetical protein ICV53_17635, partial [Flavisolibacter sp.]|nr:hypothetical protein [Flavisolibacter sp.]
TLTYGELQAGTRIGESVAVFPRIDKNKVMNEIENKKAEDANSKAEEKPGLQRKQASPL